MLSESHRRKDTERKARERGRGSAPVSYHFILDVSSPVPCGPSCRTGTKAPCPAGCPSTTPGAQPQSRTQPRQDSPPSATSICVPGQPVSPVRASRDFLFGKIRLTGLQMWGGSMRQFRSQPTPVPFLTSPPLNSSHTLVGPRHGRL